MLQCVLQHFVALFCHVTRRVMHGEEQKKDFYAVRVHDPELGINHASE
ncbi:hypothetical protein [Brevibacillus sp. HB1.4B]|nr:hypothetical protein [Brevibacillus sp. HB1.4B]